MFRSLRFRLPAIFLAGIVLAGVLGTIISIRLFEDYFRDRTLDELRHEVPGVTQLYVRAARNLTDVTEEFELAVADATGDRVFYVGGGPFPGQDTVLEELPQDTFDWQANRLQTFEFEKGGRTFLAAAQPYRVDREGPVFGAIVVASPKSELRAFGLTLGRRLALALLVGILIAGALAWYLSRRLTRPVLALSRAADEVAEGNYDVELPRSKDEIGDLAERFREMAARLREATELERNFLMTVSHELRTPMTAIRGHVSALREGVADDAELRALSLEAIASETARLERLVGDLLDLAKLEARRFAVRREEVDMQRVVERAYGAFDQEAKTRGIDYRQRVGERPVIVSDGDRVLQIVTNLLSNAFRWTPDGGHVELALTADNGSVSVAVEDTGPGIADDERERIFRPFWTRDGRGTGLGLAIANELALALGGRIELETTPGKGSRFQLLLPAGP